MNGRIILGSILAVFLIALVPATNAIQTQTVEREVSRTLVSYEQLKNMDAEALVAYIQILTNDYPELSEKFTNAVEDIENTPISPNNANHQNNFLIEKNKGPKQRDDNQTFLEKIFWKIYNYRVFRLFIPRRRDVEIDAGAVVLEDAAVDDDGVHIGGACLVHHVGVGVEDRRHGRRLVVLDQQQVGLLARGDRADGALHAERLRAAHGRHPDDVLGAEPVGRDGLVLRVGLEVVARAVGAQRGAHGREVVRAPPDAGVHRQRGRDAVLANLPGRRIPLTRALLALARDRHSASGRGDLLVALGLEGGGVHVGDLGRHEPAVVHLLDADVGRRAPHSGVGRDAQPHVASLLEGGTFGEVLGAGHVEGDLQAEHVVRTREVLRDEAIELGGIHPVPGAPEVVAVAEHETAWNLVEGLQRRLGVLRRPQRMRPVERCRDSGVDRLECAEQVARVDVLGAEDLPVLQVVEDEVLAERPVAAVAAQGGLPHVAVGVDHAGHQDAAACVDLDGALRHRQGLAHRGDGVARDQHVAVEDHAGGVDCDHDAVAEHDRPARSEVLGVRAGVGHLASSSLRISASI